MVSLGSWKMQVVRMKRTHTKWMVMAVMTAMLLGGCGNRNTGVQEQAAGGDHAAEEAAADNGKSDNTVETESQITETAEETEESRTAGAEESADADTDADTDSPENREKKEWFGEDCIAEQCFEVELNRCEGTVWFVPYVPSVTQPEFRMEMIRDGEVLCGITPYVPAKAGGKKFTSLDAVSFWDVNFDGFTDVATIATYGDMQTAAVYYGDMFGYEKEYWSFFREEELSDYLSEQAKAPITIAGIRELLTGGKKNGEFESYVEAYEAALNLSVMEGWAASETEYGGKFLYDLIYVDEDEIPELVSGRNGYFVNLYTYKDGSLSMPMNHWAYGAMGNSGYDYAPRKNNMRNYNADQAGAIMNTYYMRINERGEMETPMWIESVNYIDKNGNGMLDEDEEFGEGPVYINGEKASPEEVDAVYGAYDMGDYAPIEGRVTEEEVRGMLKELAAAGKENGLQIYD